MCNHTYVQEYFLCQTQAELLDKKVANFNLIRNHKFVLRSSHINFTTNSTLSKFSSIAT